MKHCLVYITTETMEDAQRIGRMLVSNRLAACVNILGRIQSMYRWEGDIQEDSEVALIAKTTELMVPRLTEKVKELHTFDCPCVVALPVVGGNEAFLDWIGEEVGGRRSD